MNWSEVSYTSRGLTLLVHGREALKELSKILRVGDIMVHHDGIQNTNTQH